MFIRIAVVIVIVFFLPLKIGAMTIVEDTVWQGEMEVVEDVVVLRGVTLTVRAGTLIRLRPAESTKTGPENLSRLTEITVRGNLKVNGTAEEPVVFSLAGPPDSGQWAGIIVDRGSVEIRYCTIRDSETALQVFDGTADLVGTEIVRNRYGMVGQGGKTRITLDSSRVHDNDYGLLALAGADIKQQGTQVSSNRKMDFYTGRSVSLPVAGPDYEPAATAASRVYGSEVLPGTTVWKGRIMVRGLVRIPVDSRLVILPGTLVEFSKRDTNGDTIGENGLMIQGVLHAKGSREKPIIFRSAEQLPKRGDWDAINILGSDRAQNLIEFCQIQDAYRGLHFHYANVSVNYCLLRHNYRGIQFQESLIMLADTKIDDNKSAIRARDSEVVFIRNQLTNNLEGTNFFRLDLQAADNLLVGNAKYGMRIREGTVEVTGNKILGNRFGLQVNDVESGRFNGNLISHNLETGLSLMNTDHIEVTGNSIQANGINGILIQDSRAAITGNLIAENGERGIGIVSLSGTITENNIVGNGRYAIGLDGAGNVDVSMNWWGTSDLDREIYDKADDSRLGEVLYEPKRQGPMRFFWPVPLISGDTSWYGDIIVPEKIQVQADATLAVKPGVKVYFESNAGLQVQGRILALGEEKLRISFTSLDQRGTGDWDEILLERAAGSRFVHCDFSYSSWGLHSHFVDLVVAGCRFTNNNGGIRFRSGPVEIKGSLFSGNHVGIRSFLGQGLFHDNIITGNEIGIFIRQGGAGLKIRRNNIFANQRYDIRLGDFNREDVDARKNWWGGKVPGQSVYDGRFEKYIGKVRFEPVLAEPIPKNGIQ